MNCVPPWFISNSFSNFKNPECAPPRKNSRVVNSVGHCFIQFTHPMKICWPWRTIPMPCFLTTLLAMIMFPMCVLCQLLKASPFRTTVEPQHLILLMVTQHNHPSKSMECVVCPVEPCCAPKTIPKQTMNWFKRLPMVWPCPKLTRNNSATMPPMLQSEWVWHLSYPMHHS